MKASKMIEAFRNSRRDYCSRESALLGNGWRRGDTTGMWKHVSIGGLHNIASAERWTAISKAVQSVPYIKRRVPHNTGA